MSQNNLAPKRYSQKFSKLNWEKIAWRHLLKSQKYWNCKVLLGIITTTITQLNSLFVWIPCIIDPLCVDVWWSSWWNGPNSSQLSKVYSRRTTDEAVLFFCVITRHTNIKTDKRLINVLPGVYILLSSSSWEDSNMYTPGSIANSQRMLIETNKSGTITKIRIWVESDNAKHQRHLE